MTFLYRTGSPVPITSPLVIPAVLMPHAAQPRLSSINCLYLSGAGATPPFCRDRSGAKKNQTGLVSTLHQAVYFRSVLTSIPLTDAQHQLLKSKHLCEGLIGLLDSIPTDGSTLKYPES